MIREEVLQSIKHNDPALKSLDLEGQNLDAEDAKQLAQALESNTTLRSLSLFGNEIGDEGAKYLAQALRNNKTLTHLQLGRNNIGDEGARDLGKALEVNTSLTRFSMPMNKISVELSQELVGFMIRNISDKKDEIDHTIKALNLINGVQEAIEKKDILRWFPDLIDEGGAINVSKVSEMIRKAREHIDNIVGIDSFERLVAEEQRTQLEDGFNLFVDNLVKRNLPALLKDFQKNPDRYQAHKLKMISQLYDFEKKGWDIRSKYRLMVGLFGSESDDKEIRMLIEKTYIQLKRLQENVGPGHEHELQEVTQDQEEKSLEDAMELLIEAYGPGQKEKNPTLPRQAPTFFEKKGVDKEHQRLLQGLLDVFLRAYEKEYNSETIKSPTSKQWHKMDKAHLSLTEIKAYADKHPKSRTADVLKALDSEIKKGPNEDSPSSTSLKK